MAVRTRSLCLLRTILALAGLAALGALAARADQCDTIFQPDKVSKHPNCPADKDKQVSTPAIYNLAHLSGVYCFNNNSGLCKAFAGRFEFHFDSFADKFLGPAPASEFVDSSGYHSRVPISYTPTGDILYADRALNWADEYTNPSRDVPPTNLLSVNDFNWCGFTENNLWPYKSSVKDVKSNARFHIFFFNRQSCIFDTQTGLRQHYNTRYMHNTSLRIDLDMNPTIFAMEDKLAGATRLVRHKRQHFYETDFEVLQVNKTNVRYFLSIAAQEQTPCKITKGHGNLLSSEAYKEQSDVCLSDYYHNTRMGKNAMLFTYSCGSEQTEISDLNVLDHDKGRGPIEVSLHNLPKWPQRAQSYYGIDVKDNADWAVFAKDGVIFSATTSMPVANSSDRVRVISLFARFRPQGAEDMYDEYYPLPHIAKYEVKYVGNGQPVTKTTPRDDWQIDQKTRTETPIKNLNYVDDIAYLDKCNTILAIFGPLYSEFAPDKFGDLSVKAPIGSITKLGIWELANAFTAQPKANTLYAYHRLNYVAAYTYTCASGPGKLVTAQRSSQYHHRWGPDSPPALKTINELGLKYSEEFLFQQIGVFKGNTDQREAPDPAKFRSEYDATDEATEPANQGWVYWMVALGIILIVAMLIICFYTMRRWRKQHRLEDIAQTLRSGMPSGASSITGGSTIRSGATQFSTRASLPTSRSVLPSATSGGMSRSLPHTLSRSSALRGPPNTSRSSAASRAMSSPSRKSSRQSATRAPRSSRGSHASRGSSASRASRASRSGASRASASRPSVSASRPSASRASKS